MAKMNWRDLTARLGDLTEKEVKALLDEEIAQHKRPAIIRRLHQRYSSLRTMRERDELLERIKT